MNRIALSSSKISVVQLPQVGDVVTEDVVMIHGIAANLGFWYATAAQGFTRFGRVTLYDMRGHGHSDMPPSGYSPGQMADDLRQLLDHLKLDKVHLVAHSFGGMVALCFVLLHPDRVKSIVLADVRLWQMEPPSWKAVSPAWRQRMRDAGLQLNETHMDPSFQVLVELARLRLGRPESATTAASAHLDIHHLLQKPRAARRWLDLIETTGAYAEMTSGADFTLVDLTRIKQPMLALFGEHSLRKRSARALQRHCPQCQLQIVPNVGHFFPLSRPAYFAKVTLKFLEATTTTISHAGNQATVRPRYWERIEMDEHPATAAAAAPV